MAYYRALDISVGDNDLAHFKYIKRWKEGNEWRYQYPGDNTGGRTSTPGSNLADQKRMMTYGYNYQGNNRNSLNLKAPQPAKKSGLGVREALNYANAKRQTRNYANYGAKAAQNYVDATKAQKAAYESAKHPFNLDGNSWADKVKGAVNTTKNTNAALKTLNTATAGYNQAKKYEDEAKSSFEKTTLGRASKQIQTGMDWISKMFKDFTASAAPAARAIKEGVESAYAAKKSKDAYDTYMNGRNSDSPVKWDEYNRKQGMAARDKYTKEHSEYAKARKDLDNTATGRSVSKILDKADSYINSKYSTPADRYKNPVIDAAREEERKRRARAAAGYRTK